MSKEIIKNYLNGLALSKINFCKNCGIEIKLNNKSLLCIKCYSNKYYKNNNKKYEKNSVMLEFKNIEYELINLLSIDFGVSKKKFLEMLVLDNLDKTFSNYHKERVKEIIKKLKQEIG